MPESFFILSKENLELAIDEITTITKSFDRFAKIKIISNLIIIQSKTNWKKNFRTCNICKNIWTNFKKNVWALFR